MFPLYWRLLSLRKMNKLYESMEAMTIEKLKMLEAKHGTQSAPKKRRCRSIQNGTRIMLASK